MGVVWERLGVGPLRGLRGAGGGTVLAAAGWVVGGGRRFFFLVAGAGFFVKVFKVFSPDGYNNTSWTRSFWLWTSVRSCNCSSSRSYSWTWKCPVVQQRRVPTVQTVQKTVESPQVQFLGDVAVNMRRQVQQFSATVSGVSSQFIDRVLGGLAAGVMGFFAAFCNFFRTPSSDFFEPSMACS